MAYGEGADPRTATLKNGAYVYGPGKLLTMDGTNNTLDLTAATEICIGVSAGEGSRDATLAYDATGATVSYYPLGGVLMVQSAASAEYTVGCTVYVGADGLATATAGSNKKLGLYVGSGETTGALGPNGAGDTAAATSEGDLIAVMTAGAAIA